MTPSITLLHGRYQVALHDVVCDASFTDAPYSKRTHEGNVAERNDGADMAALSYAHWTDVEATELVDFVLPRTRGWAGFMCDDELTLPYKLAMERHGRVVFAPIPLLAPTPRMAGDGPASCAVYLMVCRPSSREYSTWGSLPGWYEYRRVPGLLVDDSVEPPRKLVGRKPVDMMQRILGDYTRPGDTVMDCCVGGASTLIAAALLGRSGIGSEADELTHAAATREVRRHQGAIAAVAAQEVMPWAKPVKARQEGLAL